MSMKLTSADLRKIAETVDKIQEIDLNVRQVQVAGHTVIIKRTDDQRNGTSYLVQGITDKEPTGTIYRGE